MARIRRSPAELIAAMQEKIQALQAKAEGRSYSAPVGSQIHSAIASLEREELNLRKDLSDGPQGCDARENVHRLWIEEIQARAAFAEVRLQEVLALKKVMGLYKDGDDLPNTATQHLAAFDLLQRATTARKKQTDAKRTAASGKEPLDFNVETAD